MKRPMSKLKMHLPDLTAANIDRLAARFPKRVKESAPLGVGSTRQTPSVRWQDSGTRSHRR